MDDVRESRFQRAGGLEVGTSEPMSKFPETPMKTGIEIIAEERARQLKHHGWTPEHDDGHTTGDLTDAAICYATVASAEVRGSSAEEWTPEIMTSPHCLHSPWPWEHEAWKPSDDPIHNLAKAGALIAAEIDRLMRFHKSQAQPQSA